MDLANKPFVDGLREGVFLVQCCRRCGACYWPASYCRDHPDDPFMAAMEWRPIGGRGTILTYNVHMIAFDPAWADEIPYVYAVVELEEGPAVTGRVVDCDPEEVSIGAPVVVEIREASVTDDFPEPVFLLVRE